MKKILLDILFGFIAIIVVTIFEFLVTLPFGESGELQPAYSAFINRELLLTALPAALTTFSLTALLKTRSLSDSLRRAIIWTSMLGLSFVMIGLGNNNLPDIFLTAGIYVLLACTLAGPMIYAKIRHLE